MRKLYETYKTVILYLVFGVCTTLVNLACYHVLYDRLGAENQHGGGVGGLRTVRFFHQPQLCV